MSIDLCKINIEHSLYLLLNLCDQESLHQNLLTKDSKIRKKCMSQAKNNTKSFHLQRFGMFVISECEDSPFDNIVGMTPEPLLFDVKKM